MITLICVNLFKINYLFEKNVLENLKINREDVLDKAIVLMKVKIELLELECLCLRFAFLQNIHEYGRS